MFLLVFSDIVYYIKYIFFIFIQNGLVKPNKYIINKYLNELIAPFVIINSLNLSGVKWDCSHNKKNNFF